MQVALVHDWLTGMRGGEKVLEAFCRLYPGADLYTMVHVPGAVSPTIEDRRIVTSWIQRLPGASKRYRSYLPLMPMAVEQFDLGDYDLVLSSSHCVAKGVLTRPDALHVSYLHTPMRYAWDLWPQYFPERRRLRRLVAAPFLTSLRQWDVTSAKRVDRFLANSSWIARRIRKFYGRRATVVHPPVDASRFEPAGGPGDYYLMVTAMVPYKNADLVLEAFGGLDRRLVIVGDGPLRREWSRRAGPNVEFTGWVSDRDLVDHYSRCRALIMPAVEDFGIVPLEANAAGRPVIALGRAGALDTVVPLGSHGNAPGPTGVLFEQPDAEHLVQALRRFEEHEPAFDPAVLRAHAFQFDLPRFERRMRDLLDETLRIWENTDPEAPQPF